jgi:hypothetical protein
MSTSKHLPIAIDMLDRVRAYLIKNWSRRAQLEFLSGVDYWVILRIKNKPDVEPGYGKVLALAKAINQVEWSEGRTKVRPKVASVR